MISIILRECYFSKKKKKSLFFWGRKKIFLCQYTQSLRAFLYVMKALCCLVPCMFKSLQSFACVSSFFNITRAHYQKKSPFSHRWVSVWVWMCFLVLLAALDHGTEGSLPESVYALICIAACCRGYCCQMGFWWMFFTIMFLAFLGQIWVEMFIFHYSCVTNEKQGWFINFLFYFMYSMNIGAEYCIIPLIDLILCPNWTPPHTPRHHHHQTVYRKGV